MDKAVTATGLAPAASRRKRSPRQTVASIISAAREQFSQKGVHGANIEDIASSCGYTRQLIYHYFGSKEGLYEAVLNSAREEATRRITSQDYEGLPPAEALASYIRLIYDLFLSVPEWRYFMLEENIQDGRHQSVAKSREAAAPLVRQFCSIVQRGVDAGVFRAGMDLEKLYALFYVMVHSGTLIRNTVASVIDVDLISEPGAEAWGDYLVEQFLNIVRAPAPSA